MPKIEIIARGLAQRDPENPKVLLCKSILAGHTYLPGGHVEFGESAQQALRREMIEETGLSVDVGQLLTIHQAAFTQSGKQRHEINLVFHMKHCGPKNVADGSENGEPWPENVPSRESEIDFLWVPRSELRAAAMLPERLAELLERSGNEELPSVVTEGL